MMPMEIMAWWGDLSGRFFLFHVKHYVYSNSAERDLSVVMGML